MARSVGSGEEVTNLDGATSCVYLARNFTHQRDRDPGRIYALPVEYEARLVFARTRHDADDTPIVRATADAETPLVTQDNDTARRRLLRAGRINIEVLSAVGIRQDDIATSLDPDITGLNGAYVKQKSLEGSKTRGGLKSAGFHFANSYPLILDINQALHYHGSIELLRHIFAASHLLTNR
ncbi:hypothetical protein OG592_42240 (plasmid) [Streptomyces avidinii]|uniref:hypothetical protein n=1 Tax=Streptomyces avidinii TaxID=1895 RepID=UPI002F9147D1|nr:hypothetical protein OG592_42240 [Streptomyces avidinii]